MLEQHGAWTDAMIERYREVHGLGGVEIMRTPPMETGQESTMHWPQPTDPFLAECVRVSREYGPNRTTPAHELL
jgi:hypothetical protein